MKNGVSVADYSLALNVITSSPLRHLAVAAGHGLECLGQGSSRNCSTAVCHQHHAMAFLENTPWPSGEDTKGVIAQPIHRQLDIAKLQFELAALSDWAILRRGNDHRL